MQWNRVTTGRKYLFLVQGSEKENIELHLFHINVWKDKVAKIVGG